MFDWLFEIVKISWSYKKRNSLPINEWSTHIFVKISSEKVEISQKLRKRVRD
jgi:hypothetical protein